MYRDICTFTLHYYSRPSPTIVVLVVLFTSLEAVVEAMKPSVHFRPYPSFVTHTSSTTARASCSLMR